MMKKDVKGQTTSLESGQWTGWKPQPGCISKTELKEKKNEKMRGNRDKAAGRLEHEGAIENRACSKPEQ